MNGSIVLFLRLVEVGWGEEKEEEEEVVVVAVFVFFPFFHRLLWCWDGSGYAIQMLVPPALGR